MAQSFTLSSAFADASCPSLAGKYAKCQSDDPEDKGSRDVVITEKTENNITTYSLESTDNETDERSTLLFIADGISRSENVGGEPDDLLVTTVNCAQDSIKVSNKIVIQNQEVASLESTGFKQGNKFIYNSQGSVLGEEVKQSMVCE